MYQRLRDCSLRGGGGGGGGEGGIWARLGARGRKVPLLPRAWSRALIPFPFPFNAGHAG